MKAFYAGSFNPFTIGHLAVAKRALECFEELIIGVGYNESKANAADINERVSEIEKLFKGESRVKVTGYNGLTAEAARKEGAGILVRGVRNASDFEKEKELADINLEVLDMPTVMFPAPPSVSYVSSSMVRELSHFGYDVAAFLPQSLEEKTRSK